MPRIRVRPCSVHADSSHSIRVRPCSVHADSSHSIVVDNNSDVVFVRRPDSSFFHQKVFAEFYKNISPLLTSMRLFGIYFNLPEPAPITLFDEYQQKETPHPGSRSRLTGYRTKGARARPGGIWYVYSCVMLILLWLNAVRMATMFTPKDSFNAYLLAKLVTYVWVIMCTCMHTIFFLASRSGRLAHITDELAERACRSGSDVAMDTTKTNDNSVNKETLDDLPVYDVSGRLPSTLKLSSSDNEIIRNIPYLNDVRKCTRVCTVIGWLFLTLNSSFVSYINFCTPISGNTRAPINTYITNVSPYIINAVDIVYEILVVYMSAAWSFTTAMSFLISFCLSKKFLKLNHELKSSLKLDRHCNSDHGGTFSGNIESFRVRHHKITRLVEKADKFLCFYYGCSIVGHIAMFSLMLYITITPVFHVGTLALVVGSFWIVTSIGEISVVAAGAILVNNAVSLL